MKFLQSVTNKPRVATDISKMTAPTSRSFWLPAVHRLVVTVWVGVTWTIGLLAAPLAFSVIEPRSLAGTFASHAFYWQSVIALFCAAIILLLHARVERRLELSKPLVIVMLVMAGLAALQQFLLAPIMAGVRVELMSAVNEAARTQLSGRFGWLHGLSSLMYFSQCALGAVLVVKGR